METRAAKRIRLRTKTSSGDFAGLAARSHMDIARVPELLRGMALSAEYLEAAGLRAKEKAGRKKVYLVTLPHPRVLGQGGLQAPVVYDRL